MNTHEEALIKSAFQLATCVGFIQGLEVAEENLEKKERISKFLKTLESIS